MSVSLTEEQQRRIKNLKIKSIVKGIVDSDEPDNVKSHIIQYVIDLYLLKRRQYDAKRRAKPEDKEKRRKRHAARCANPEFKEKARKGPLHGMPSLKIKRGKEKEKQNQKTKRSETKTKGHGRQRLWRRSTG